jgi:cell division protein FtsN
MTKDFKIQPGNNSGFNQYGMGWVLGGIAIGLLAGLALYNLSKHSNAGDAPPPQVSTDTQTAPQVTANTGSTADKPASGSAALHDTPAREEPQDAPVFSYHAVLPQMEVGLPLAIEEAAPKAEKTQKATPKPPANAETKTDNKTTTPPTGKMGKTNGFQLGSYTTEAQAANLRARLSSKGMNTRIEKAEVKGQTVYRVRIGPATSPEMLDKWQQTLSGMGITPLGVRM